MRNCLRSLLLMGLLFNFNNRGPAQDNPGLTDRKPAAAGRFYPGEPDELRSTLARLFSKAKPPAGSNVAGIVCPHAGYVFSGRVAASAYNQVDPGRQYDNVFVIASSHQVSFDGASVYNRGDYLTPLGKVKVNIELANELISKNPVLTFNPEADKTEHSLEVQIPFLQYHLNKDFKLVPIVIGAQTEESCRKIARALKPYFNDRNLFVFSTDFSHYPSYSDAQTADKATSEAIASGSPDGLMKFLGDYRKKNVPNLSTNLCGWTSILVMLNLTGGEPGVKISPVQYMNSGDSEYGDTSQVVGYYSFTISRPVSGTEQSSAFDFTESEKILLLKIARNTVDRYIREGRMPDDSAASYPANLNIRAGAFVTLHKAGELRGCIGRFSSDAPLYRLIRELSVASSTEDSRFEPVRPGETDQVDIEISVLSPLKKIRSASEITLGKHGIYMKKGAYSGTFLPQVAIEQGWNLDEFLGHCARDKAGIGWNGWKEAELFTYESCIFSEKEFIGRKD